MKSPYPYCPPVKPWQAGKPTKMDRVSWKNHWTQWGYPDFTSGLEWLELQKSFPRVSPRNSQVMDYIMLNVYGCAPGLDHTLAHAHTHIYIYTYIYIYAHICTYTYIHTYIHTYIYIYMYMHMYMYIYTNYREKENRKVLVLYAMIILSYIM